MGARKLRPDVARHFRRWVLRYVDQHHEGKRTVASRALGMAANGVGRVEQNHFGQTTIEQVASATGRSLRELTGYDDPFNEGRVSPDFAFDSDDDVAPLSDRYPSRARLIVLARNKVPAEYLEALSMLAADSYKGKGGQDVDPGFDYWIDRLKEIREQAQLVAQFGDGALGDEAHLDGPDLDAIHSPKTQRKPRRSK